MKVFAVLVTLTIICACVQADVSHITAAHQPGAQPYVFSYQAGRAPGHVDHQHTEVSDGSGVIRGAFSYIDPHNEVRTVQYTADKYGFHPELSHKVEDTEAVKRGKEKHLAEFNRIAHEHEQQRHEIAAQHAQEQHYGAQQQHYAAQPQQHAQQQQHYGAQSQQHHAQQQHYAQPQQHAQQQHYGAQSQQHHAQQQHYAQTQHHAQQQHYVQPQQYHHQAASYDAPEQSEAVIRETQKHLNEFDRIAAEHAAIGRRQEAERKALLAQHAHSHTDEDDGQYHPENEHY